MLEPINLLRYSKYGFLTSLSALLSFVAASNETARTILIYVLVASIILSILAFFMRSTELDEDGRARYLLKDTQRFELVAIVALFVLGIMVGVA
jgi:hypothetical protein